MVWRQLDEYLRPAWYIWSSYRLVSAFKIYSSTTSRSRVLIPQDQKIGGGLHSITETAGSDPYRMKDDYIIWTRWVSVPRRRGALSLFKRQPMKVQNVKPFLGAEVAHGGLTLLIRLLHLSMAIQDMYERLWNHRAAAALAKESSSMGRRRGITWPVPLWRRVAFRPHLRVPYIGELSAHEAVH